MWRPAINFLKTLRLLYIYLFLVVFNYCFQIGHTTGQDSFFKGFDDLENLLKQSVKNSQSKNFANNFNFHQENTENRHHGFHDHDIVVPIRLHHESGHPVSHGRHFRRRTKGPEEQPKWRRRNQGSIDDNKHYLRDVAYRQRFNHSKSGKGTFYDVIPDKYSGESMDFIQDDDGEYLDHTVANYSIKAFNGHYLFHLTPYDDFLAPNYSLRFLGDPKKDKPLHPDVPRHCFYSGYVNGKKEHRAVLSVCRGLFGAFHTATHDYLIQPEDVGSDLNQDEFDEEGTKPHKIFRRSIKNKGKKERQLCGFVEPENDPTSEGNRDSITGEVEPHVGRRLAQQTRIIGRRKLSRLRLLLRSVKARSNTTLSGSILRRMGISTLINSAQVIEALKSNEPEIIEERRSKSSAAHDRIKRRRRYLSHPRHVEVMVTADNSLFRLHHDVEHYVLTLMAIVNHVYHDPSIENLINIVVVELVVIGDSQVENGPRVVSNAHSCLKNFCEWQFHHNNPDDSHPSHHDTAVLITGQNICRSASYCETLGLAELGTICNPRKSCSINEDNGLSTAFTIAHEIGHEFNAYHDNNEKCKDSNGQTVSLNVMAPTLDISAHPWTWSRCSAKYITGFLDNGSGRCLLDEPPRRVLSLPAQEPGEVFNANDQCSFVYGKGVTHCNFMIQNSCKRLWCTSQNVTHGCRTPHVPWADGTSCGNRMWCQRGKCVPENRDRYPIDGNWGEWSHFGECSRTCGGGVKSAFRKCNYPEPQHGGKYCTGRRKKYRPCNYQECPVGSDFRAEQCAAFNGSPKFHRHRVRGVSPNDQWIPKYDGIPEQDRCKLTCQVRSKEQHSSTWYILNPKVINGTPCGSDTHDICVEGICKPAGCDHVLNSRSKEDNCGICNGNNTECKLVQGRYNSGYNIGYNRVVVIPSGATNIVITQQSYSGDANDNNYLALRDSRGSYILNGNRSVMKNKLRVKRRAKDGSRKYSYFCDYTGTATNIETVNCTRVIGIDMVVEVLSAGDLMPPNINYRYNIPTREALTYRWNPNGQWSTCSDICNGKTKQKIFCVRSDGQVVSDRKCERLPKPRANVRSCNTKCQFVWNSEPSRCSVRCGEGTMQVDYKCQKVTNAVGDDINSSERLVEIVRDDLCPQPKPDDFAPCQGECLPTSWRYGDWRECSQTCDGGTQTRSATCYDTRGSEFSPDQCDASSLVTSRLCFTRACPRWMTSRLSECSTTCGKGIEVHRVWCGVGHSVRPDEECDSGSKPSMVVSCKTHECPKWQYGKWDECSATCGQGEMRRSYRCVDAIGRSLDSSMCDSSQLLKTRSCSAPRSCRIEWSSNDGDFPSIVVRRGPRPTTTTTTTTTTLPSTSSIARSASRNRYNSDIYPDVFVINSRQVVARWRTGSWTPCTKSCGTGMRLRYVSCRHIESGREMKSEHCGREELRPQSKEDCQTRSCPGKWKTGPWSPCSTSCVDGTKSRYVGCFYNGRYARISPHCLPEEKPAEHESCRNLTGCPDVTTTTTSLVTRTISKNNNDNDDEIIEPRSPRGERRQNLLSVGWRTGSWSRCSTLCGEGVRKRVVLCLTSAGKSSSHCDPENRPKNNEKCSGTNCPRWRFGQWSKCSRNCGNGTRTRKLYCVNAKGRSTYQRACSAFKRPPHVIQCNSKPCRQQYRWKKGRWSSCSATCGRGTKTRQLQCVDRRGQTVDDSLCANVRRSQPKKYRRCVVRRRCPKWRTRRWKQCSATCDDGNQHRRVVCKYKGHVVQDALCDVASRPGGVRQCNVMACPSYEWHARDWSTCSTSCGEGMQERGVVCRIKGKNRVVDDVLCRRYVSDGKPIQQQTCQVEPCNASWKLGPWSECSLSCGPGIQQRDVRCVYIHPLNYTELEANSCDVNNEPYRVRDCDRGSCTSRYYWRVGSWSQCSATCGGGLSVRRVECSDRLTQSPQPDHVCRGLPSLLPDRSRSCRAPPCVPQSCQQLKTQQNPIKDGEYFINITNVMVRIYCKDMNSSQPTDYLTLVSGSVENYSEIFGFRLIDAESCPSNGSRDPHCACHRDHPDEGHTTFEKVRFDVSSLRVLVNDFTFAKTRFGRSVAFGVAGDCYSRRNCPQGVFRINLKGTGFVVSEQTRWRPYGTDSSIRIYRSDVGDMVAGNCGGYCSRCQPDPTNGLLLKPLQTSNIN